MKMCITKFVLSARIANKLRQHDLICPFLTDKDYLFSEGLCKIIYLREVRPHGVLVSIISDRGAQFAAQLWKSFQKGLGSKVNLSTVFHPQTSGQAEHIIQSLEDMLMACVINFKGNWDDPLLIIEFSYNNSYHASSPSDISHFDVEEVYG
ncbi:hypothetical protein MTR67_051028 [Solanum verrucosum]|uniref:Integrase catalytic domain-containing protein n=1 Tax=Solanum verrucosum TaxID=315347 RepID=A0AAF0V6J5_SOLVR|nr:hypothetical protein MTR67_051028 [Solanum verrucosum]